MAVGVAVTVVTVVRFVAMAATFTVNMSVMAFMSMPFVAVVAAFGVCMRMRAIRLSGMRLVAVAAAFAVCVSMFMLGFASACFMVMAATVAVSMFMLGFANMCFGAMAAAFAVLMSVFTSTRLVTVTAAFTMPVAVSVIIGMRVSMPFVPVGKGFDLLRAVGFGNAVVRHGWLPGSICGLVNTLKPLQGQGRNLEGP
jgi:hypothetical protein